MDDDEYYRTRGQYEETPETRVGRNGMGFKMGCNRIGNITVVITKYHNTESSETHVTVGFMDNEPHQKNRTDSWEIKIADIKMTADGRLDQRSTEWDNVMQLVDNKTWLTREGLKDAIHKRFGRGCGTAVFIQGLADVAELGSYIDFDAYYDEDSGRACHYFEAVVIGDGVFRLREIPEPADFECLGAVYQGLRP